MSRRTLALTLAALALGGCATVSAGHAAYDTLSPAQKEDIRNCQQPLVRAQCGSNSKTAGDQSMASILAGPGASDAVCINGLIAEYAKQGDKKKWLVRKGCPKDMVYADVDEDPDVTDKDDE